MEIAVFRKWPMQLVRGLIVLLCSVIALIGFGTLSFAAGAPKDGMILHLTADAGVTKNADGYVSEWADQSGKGNGGFSKNDSKPLYVAKAYKGKAALRFDGADDFIRVKGVAGTKGNFTVSFMLKPSLLIDWNQIITTGDDSFKFHTTADGSIYAGQSVESRIEPADGPAPGTLAVDDWIRVSYVYADGKAKLYKNSKLVATKAINAAQPWGNLEIGLPNAYTLSGDLTEIIVYNRALSDSEREAVEASMLTKYDPNASAPAASNADSGATTAPAKTDSATTTVPAKTDSATTESPANPKTGDQGIGLYVIGAVASMGLAILLLTTRNRKHKGNLS